MAADINARNMNSKNAADTDAKNMNSRNAADINARNMNSRNAAGQIFVLKTWILEML